MIAASALGMWVLTQPDVADDAAVQQALGAGVFATGGPGFALPAPRARAVSCPGSDVPVRVRVCLRACLPVGPPHAP
jgi:hypothetical protein